MVFVELSEDADELVGNAAVADHLAPSGLSVVVPVEQTEVAQVVAADMGIVAVGLALHPVPYGVGHRQSYKVLPVEAGHVGDGSQERQQ